MGAQNVREMGTGMLDNANREELAFAEVNLELAAATGIAPDDIADFSLVPVEFAPLEIIEEPIAQMAMSGSAPLDATITARVDTQHWIYVNGELVSFGLGWRKVKTITTQLEAGDVIAIRARDTNGGEGGVFVDIALDGGIRLSSDGTWLVETTVSGDWTSQSFDDSAWVNATEYGGVLTDPWIPGANDPMLPADSDGQWIWSADNVNTDEIYLRFVVPSSIGGPNEDPVVDIPVADQIIDEDSAFSLVVPITNFSDADNDPITLSAQLADGSALPSWLTFDDTTGTFSGTPGQADVGVLTVRITASDGRGGSVSDDFSITINNVNDVPTVETPITDQTTFYDDAYNFVLPATTFSDEDGDMLSLSARLANGDPLPTWLSFDELTGTFSGTPTSADQDILQVEVFADDGNGGLISDIFELSVEELPTGPLDATMMARVDSQHWIYVNGELVSTGLGWRKVKTILTQLEEGDVIAIRARDTNGGEGGVFVDIALETGERIATSSDWLVTTTVSGDWTSQSFDDSAWVNATEYGGVLTDPWDSWRE